MAPAWDVFIAYASADREWADALHAALRRRGIHAFVDHRVLHPGDEWPQVLQEALASCRCVAALIPPGDVAAFFQRDEILFAIDAARARPARLRLVPIYVAGAHAGDGTPYGLRALQHLAALTLDDLDGVADGLAGVVARIGSSDENDAARAPAEAAPDDVQGRRVAPAIRARMAALQREVTHLTEEQFRAIQQLRWLRRVRISGCAGSGKTLVAAEKAVRMAQAGQRVLFLCHNPLLAEHIRALLNGSGAVALAFGAWVDELAAVADHVANDEVDSAAAAWSHLLEPDDAALAAAQRRLHEAGGVFDAIIVDEAQDFRDAWWPLVEGAMRDPVHGTLYLFHDDEQTLLPRRGRYPVGEPVIDLSRNCRNAGRVYELMRRFDSAAPRSELLLREHGQALVRCIEVGTEPAALVTELQQLALEGLLDSTTVLWSGAEPLASCPVAGLPVELGMALGWQEEVLRRLGAVYDHVAAAKGAQGMRLPVLPPAQALADLSRAPVPDTDGVERVQDYARQFGAGDVSAGGRRTVKFGCVAEGGTWRLRRTVRDQGPAERANALARFFGTNGWAAGIGRPQRWRVTPFFELPRADAVPLYAVGDFKGLEADVIVLLMRGKTVAHRSSTYVGVSRARAVLRVLADAAALQVFPRDHPWG